GAGGVADAWSGDGVESLGSSRSNSRLVVVTGTVPSSSESVVGIFSAAAGSAMIGASVIRVDMSSEIVDAKAAPPVIDSASTWIAAAGLTPLLGGRGATWF